jgi:hypothetical protein
MVAACCVYLAHCWLAGKGHGKKSDGAGPGMPGSPSAGGGAGMGGGKTKVSARAAAQYGNVMQLVNTSNKRL